MQLRRIDELSQPRSSYELTTDLSLKDYYSPNEASPQLRKVFPALSQHLLAGSLVFSWHRRREHEKANKRDIWSLRGIGYAWDHHESLVLAGLLPDILVEGQNTLKIVPTTPQRSDCAKWVLTIRVSGPTGVKAMGIPTPIVSLEETESCYWEYMFDLEEAGLYNIDARIIMWNNEASAFDNRDSNLCSFDNSDVYEPACCEICSRAKNCQDWSYHNETSCEITLDNKIASIDLTSELGNKQDSRAAGDSASITPGHQYHLVGCGWDMWSKSSNACLDVALDDAIPVFPNNTFPFPQRLSLDVPNLG
jgi:hypothetical protein